MKKNRTPKTNEQQAEDRNSEAQRRREQIAAEDRAIDAMIRESLKFHGP